MKILQIKRVLKKRVGGRGFQEIKQNVKMNPAKTKKNLENSIPFKNWKNRKMGKAKTQKSSQQCAAVQNQDI